MIVEFVGGSLDGQSRTIEQIFEYITTDVGEVYFARAIQYKNLNWVYLWYQLGNQTAYKHAKAQPVYQ